MDLLLKHFTWLRLAFVIFALIPLFEDKGSFMWILIRYSYVICFIVHIILEYTRRKKGEGKTAESTSTHWIDFAIAALGELIALYYHSVWRAVFWIVMGISAVGNIIEKSHDNS